MLSTCEPGCELRTIFRALSLGKSRAHAARFSYSLGRTRGIVGVSGGWLGAQKSRMQDDLQRLALISFHRNKCVACTAPDYASKNSEKCCKCRILKCCNTFTSVQHSSEPQFLPRPHSICAMLCCDHNLAPSKSFSSVYELLGARLNDAPLYQPM